MVRGMHFYLIVSVYVRSFFKTSESKMFLIILQKCEYFVYYATFLYLQFKMTEYDFELLQKDHKKITYFMMLEILTFYTQIFTMVIFLLYIMCRGAIGKKDYKANEQRYKFDAIEYYKIDIMWLSF